MLFDISARISFFLFNFYFYFILLYNTLLVLPYIDINPPRVYVSSQTWIPLPSSSPYHLSGSTPWTILSCLNCLYLLNINPLLVISYAVIFPFSTLFLHSFHNFLCCAKTFKVAEIPFLYFCFSFLCLGDNSKKILLWYMSKSDPNMFSSRSFMFSGLTFRSLAHLEFILHLVLENVLI